jgi:hypothetical protein
MIKVVMNFNISKFEKKKLNLYSNKLTQEEFTSPNKHILKNFYLKKIELFIQGIQKRITFIHLLKLNSIC